MNLNVFNSNIMPEYIGHKNRISKQVSTHGVKMSNPMKLELSTAFKDQDKYTDISTIESDRLKEMKAKRNEIESRNKAIKEKSSNIARESIGLIGGIGAQGAIVLKQ